MTRWRFAIGLCLAAVLWTGAAYSQPAPVEGQQPPIEEADPERDPDSAEGQDISDTEPPEAEQALPEPEARLSEPIDATPSEPETDAHNTEADEEAREIARRDLAAQDRMADAAWGQVALTFIGVLLIAWTLYYTRRAVEEASEATKAANAAVAETGRIGEAQIRAYLYCASAKYRLSKERVTAILELENTGQSPASNVSISGSATVHDVAGFRSRFRVIAWAGSESSSVLCQPITSHGNITEEITFFWEINFPLEEGENPKVKEMIFTTGNEVWFDLVVRWSDVFSKNHEFRLNLSGIVDAHPLNPKKKRSRSGTLDFRMEDARFAYQDDGQSE